MTVISRKVELLLSRVPSSCNTLIHNIVGRNNIHDSFPEVGNAANPQPEHDGKSPHRDRAVYKSADRFRRC